MQTPSLARRPPADDETEFLILGAGVTGLAAASVLGDRAILLERDDRPGGLVRTDVIDGFWFDHVLHLLHLSDPIVEAHVRRLLGDMLAPCPPDAWVETAAGVTRYPFQMHLAPLDRETVVRCLADLAEVTHRDTAGAPPAHFEAYLLRTFGRGLCDLFLLPYNRKVWKRPLDRLAPSGFTWNIARPELASVLRGALDREAPYRAYNANGWYPRPPAGAPWRGMELLSRALARDAADLRCGHEVIAIDPAARIVIARHAGGKRRIRYRAGCVSTLPLPAAIRLCTQAPPDLRQACASLARNRVITVMIGVRGPRPAGTGQWRYYADESILFNRLVFLHAFDPDCAPADGWSLLAEVTEPAEQPPGDAAALTQRVLQDVERVGALPPGSRIAVTATRVIDPAYVVFSVSQPSIAGDALAWLTSQGISSLGRYGRWEYSSIGQNLRDGFAWAEAQTGMRADRSDPASGQAVTAAAARRATAHRTAARGAAC